MICTKRTHTIVGARWKMKNRFVPAFFHGLLVASLLYTAIESEYDQELFDNITTTIRNSSTEQVEDSFLLKALHISHKLLKDRQQFFQSPFTAFKANIYYPVTFDLMTASGACGSYSRVLARILQNAGIQVRLGGMTVNGCPGGHIIVEAKTNHGWVVLDALYDLYFITPGGRLAGFSDVHGNWSYFKDQLPAGYDPDYKYEGIFYTNWNKIPVLMPAINKILQVVLGKETTNTLSIRTWFLQPYRVAFYGLLFFYLSILLIIACRRLKAMHREKKPVKFNWLYKVSQSKLPRYPIRL